MGKAQQERLPPLPPQTGKPPAARGADLVFAAISILVSGVIVILPFLAR